MHYSVFKKLAAWLVGMFENCLIANAHQYARELAPTMNAVHRFLRGSALYPVRRVTAAAKTAKASRFRNLIYSNGFTINPNAD